MSQMVKTMDVLEEVLRERERQEEKWGQQNLPDGTGGLSLHYSIGRSNELRAMRHQAAHWAKEDNERDAAENKLSFMGVLYEEVLEAFAEDDPALLRAELVQVAAVAVKWIEAIDRRAGR